MSWHEISQGALYLSGCNPFYCGNGCVPWPCGRARIYRGLSMAIEWLLTNIVFFVLSGYVIAMVTSERERTLKQYAISRISRLYSVVLPALVLTLACDLVGSYLNPDFYALGPGKYHQDTLFLQYFLSLFLAQNFWDAGLNPGINEPFWSLSFEMIYYLMFAAIFFASGRTRIIVLCLILAIAGPTIVLLAPIWGLGYVAFLLHQRWQFHPPFKNCIAATISLACLIGIIFLSPLIRSKFQVDLYLSQRSEIPADYFDGLLFAIHLTLAPNILFYISKYFVGVSSYITWLASLTFALYLFHRPIIQILAAVEFVPPDTVMGRVYMIGITIFVVATLGRWCETQKYWIKNKLNSVF